MSLVKKLGILGIAAASFLPYSVGNLKSQETSNYAPPDKKAEYVPGELIVKFKEDPKVSGIETKFNSVNELNEKYKVKSYKDVLIFKNEPRLKKITLDEKINLFDAVKEYSNNPNVEYAEPDYILKTSFTPNDPFFDFQWAHDNTQAELGWDIERGDSNSVIAVIDTGVNYAHEDLMGNMLGDCTAGCPEGTGYDFVNVSDSFWNAERVRIDGEDYTSADNDPMDFRGHGTAVAGVAAAKGNNSLGVAGVCHDCSIMPLRAGFAYMRFGEGEREVVTSSAVANSIDYATDNNADIINMSFVFVSDEGCTSTKGTRLINDKLAYATENNVILVAAAGIMEDSLPCPAANENVIAVAATDRQDARHAGSNYGEWVDVAAPMNHFTTDISDTEYRWVAGTSGSSAYVSGLAGLILSKVPELNRNEVRNIIRQGVDVFGVDIPAPDHPIGTGRVNIYKALQLNPFIRGNSNSDKEVNLTDAVYTLNFLFRQGTSPSCMDSADANDDGYVDLADAVKTLVALFVPDRTLPAPFPNSGIDTTEDNLDCGN